MNYDAELRLFTDTLKKYGLQVYLADLSCPPSRDLTTGFFLPSEAGTASSPLRELLPPVHPATVYTITHWYSCYTYFLLPELQPETVLIVGPYLAEQLELNDIMEQAELQRIDPKFHKGLEKFYATLPILPENSHLYLLFDAFFDRIWGIGEHTWETTNHSNTGESGSLLADLRISDEENALINAAIMEERYAHENNLINAVRLGQTRRIESILSRITTSAFERRTADPVRNVKNYCIITNTLLRKAAEQGGVHPIYIDRMSSDFALKIEQLSSPSTGSALISQMAQGYCRLVRNHTTKGYSTPIQKAIILIEGNLSSDLSLARLARELNVNSSYLSTLFKKETGSTVTDYITDRRISHAKHLLKSSRLQVQTVGQLCGFEDVHYFSKVFKRLAGYTPKQYRQNHMGK